ncbi:hypothetical protein Skr01_46920 [Sphaerisporangium krabiense]|uniref:Uncharacterized protein n=1 Tax=Sphaerisporangium krabiense TaxID=763782 RepID=A0A7W8Z4G2_9ACTN|nr:hypothetical protein [Sphaerisporangium krabiense]MBB5627259.1 hypothetical protein [Sphaerisporangium krabiense]GII64607.1 hypothetical protein Skr01_46920 [Sphaerisporangium krabiense]
MKRSRWTACLLALLTAVLLGQIVASTPASATRDFYCIPIWKNGRLGWDCVSIPVVLDGGCFNCPPPPCDACAREFAIDFHESVILPADLSNQYRLALTRGLGALDQAARTSDRTAQGQWRAEAMASFRLATRTLGPSRLTVAQTGVYDRARGVIGPQTVPWLAAIGADIASGITFMQEVGGGGAPTPGRGESAAMEKFEEARLEIAQQMAFHN